MKRLNKLTAVLLAAAMTLGVTGFTALAADKKVAKIGKTEYDTIQEAVTAAGDGDKIVILRDTKENGVKVPSNKNFTIDFDGYTYTIDGTVGSTGTTTNGMQLLKGSKITLKNGTIKSGDYARILIQNYCDLTLEDITLDGSVGPCDYVLSNNNGDTLIKGETNIKAGEGKAAFDLYYWPSNGYTDGVTVTFDDSMSGSVTGKVEYGSDSAGKDDCAEKAELVIKGGDFDISIDNYKNVENPSIKITSGTFTSDVSEYMDEDSNLVEDKNGNFVIMTEDEYEDYLDSKKSHGSSYSLEEKKGGSKKTAKEEEEPVVETKEDDEDIIFSDVSKTDPNYEAIMTAYEKGWMAGIGDYVFAPNGTLTRGMAAKILWNKAGCPEPTGVAPFLDVTGDAWYAKAVAWAYEQGIILGYDAATFGPNDSLTMEQFEIMTAKANGEVAPIYTGVSPNATRGWVAGRIAL